MNREKPLSGQNVLVTRPRSLGATPLVDRLNAAGANVILHPVIEIREPENWLPVDQSLTRLTTYGTVVFLSGTGVEYFFGRFREKAPPEGLSQCKIAAIGDATAARIREYGEDVEWIPQQSNSESLAEKLIDANAPQPLLLLRANRGSKVLSDSLSDAGMEFKEVVVYESHDVESINEQTRELLEQGHIDWVTITSSSIARSTASLFGDLLNESNLASISPTSTAALELQGYGATVEAREYNFDGLLEVMIENDS